MVCASVTEQIPNKKPLVVSSHLPDLVDPAHRPSWPDRFTPCRADSFTLLATDPHHLPPLESPATPMVETDFYSVPFPEPYRATN